MDLSMSAKKWADRVATAADVINYANVQNVQPPQAFGVVTNTAKSYRLGASVVDGFAGSMNLKLPRVVYLGIAGQAVYDGLRTRRCRVGHVVNISDYSKASYIDRCSKIPQDSCAKYFTIGEGQTFSCIKPPSVSQYLFQQVGYVLPSDW